MKPTWIDVEVPLAPTASRNLILRSHRSGPTGRIALRLHLGILYQDIFGKHPFESQSFVLCSLSVADTLVSTHLLSASSSAGGEVKWHVIAEVERKNRPERMSYRQLIMRYRIAFCAVVGSSSCYSLAPGPWFQAVNQSARRKENECGTRAKQSRRIAAVNIRGKADDQDEQNEDRNSGAVQ